jgi:hypothetical protein
VDEPEDDRRHAVARIDGDDVGRSARSKPWDADAPAGGGGTWPT